MSKVVERQGKLARSISQPAVAVPGDAVVPVWTVIAVLAGLSSAWLGAGSTGLLAVGLRHACSLLAVAMICVAAWRRGAVPAIALVVAFIVSVAPNASWLPVVNIAAPAVVLAVAATLHLGARGGRSWPGRWGLRCSRSIGSSSPLGRRRGWWPIF